MSMSTEQERAEFEAWLRVKPCGAAHDFAWEAWQARAALQSQDREDAERYHHLIAKLQQAYDGESFESERFSVYCRMSSQFKGDRTIQAEITWRDKTDEPLGLSEAIDHARRIEGKRSDTTINIVRGVQ